MRIVDVKETTVSIAADVGNAIMTMAELTTRLSSTIPYHLFPCLS